MAALRDEKHTATLLQSLSKGELLALVPRGLQADLAPNNPSDSAQLKAQLVSE